MVFIRHIGDYMECGTYYAQDQKIITFHKKDGWKKEIRYIVKTYSSLMLSYVLYCYPVAETEQEEVKGCINLYHDDEKVLDEILKSAIQDAYVDLNIYYG